jgi:cold shock CspA family protein
VRGQVKLHEAPLQGRVVEIHPGQDYGKIATTDGGLVYFHRNAVVDGDFEDLKPQDAVELVAQYGESVQGPQASTVRPVSSLSR